jgi:hypothetical protein
MTEGRPDAADDDLEETPIAPGAFGAPSADPLNCFYNCLGLAFTTRDDRMAADEADQSDGRQSRAVTVAKL